VVNLSQDLKSMLALLNPHICDVMETLHALRVLVVEGVYMYGAVEEE
jgi:hypothetical protein